MKALPSLQYQNLKGVYFSKNQQVQNFCPKRFQTALDFEKISQS